MRHLFDENAPKKAANLSVNSDLLAKSRALKINLSATLEKALERELAEAEARKWSEENRRAIQSYNDFVEKMVVSLMNFASSDGGAVRRIAESE